MLFWTVPKSVSKKSFGTKAASHQTDHCNSDHRFASLSKELIVFGETTLTSQPTKGPFNYPASRQYVKAFHLIGSFHDLQLERVGPAQGRNPLEEFPCVSTICPNEPQTCAFFPDQAKQHLGTVTILNIGSMHDHGNYQSKGVYKEMPLSTIDLLSGIISMELPFSAVLTDWLSTIAALGSGSRPSASRNCIRKAPCIRSHVPSRRHVEK